MASQVEALSVGAKLVFQTAVAGFVLGLGLPMVVFSGWGASAHDAFIVALQDLFGSPWMSAGVIATSLSVFHFATAHVLGFRLTWSVPVATISIMLGIEAGFVYEIENPSQAVAAAIFAVSFVLKTVAIAVLQYSRVGGGSVESLILAVNHKLGFSERSIRIVLETVVLIVAALLGGPIGVGTVLVTFALPFSIQFTQDRLDKFNFVYALPEKEAYFETEVTSDSAPAFA